MIYQFYAVLISKIWLNNFMVQIPSDNDDSSFDVHISWEDLQGLSWIFYDELNVESIKKTTYACA